MPRRASLVVYPKWNPVRGKYIGKPKQPGCVFCRIPSDAPDHDAANHLLYRGRTCFAVLNHFPYNPGHLMLVPYAHTGDFLGLAQECYDEINDLCRKSVAILAETHRPHGFNIGYNLGENSGGSIRDHLHLHIVPRWNGDLNFIALLGGAKNLPGTLDEHYATLRPAFDRVTT